MFRYIYIFVAKIDLRRKLPQPARGNLYIWLGSISVICCLL